MATGGFALPIRKRGLFSQDSFFQDYQTGFDDAVENVMDRWGGRSHLADQFASYRQLRKDKPEEQDTIAATVSDTKDNYVIVIDLSIYVSGEITVRTIEKHAVVQAKARGNVFSRKYPLPKDTNTEGVVVAMSDEGIMTITAPKLNKKTSVVGSASVTTDEPNQANKKTSFVSNLKIDVGEPELQETTLVSERKFSQAGGQRIVPLVMEGTEPVNEATPIVMPNTESESSSKTTSCQNPNTSSSTSDERVLPIMRRGQFFKDNFFEKVWNDFESAMGDVVSQKKKASGNQSTLESNSNQQNMEQQIKQGKTESLSSEDINRLTGISIDDDCLLGIGKRRFDRLNSYRNLRDWALEDDNQASTVTKEATCYKVVLDVHKFVDGKLDVQAVVGSLEIKGQKGDMSFSRTFSLPGMEKPDQVTADLSTDGVLTVTAPL